jgi:hypothetical protein
MQTYRLGKSADSESAASQRRPERIVPATQPCCVRLQSRRARRLGFAKRWRRESLYFFSAPGAVFPAPTLSISGSIFSEVARVWPVTSADGALVSGIVAVGGRSVLPVFESSEAAGGPEGRVAALGTSWEGTCADAPPAVARSRAAKSENWRFIAMAPGWSKNVFCFEQVPRKPTRKPPRCRYLSIIA